MKPRKTKDIASVLKRKGFEQSQRHHKFFVLRIKGKKSVIRTKLSHGAKEYGAPLLSQVAKDLLLSNAELEDLLDCPLGYKKYVQLVRLRVH